MEIKTTMATCPNGHAYDTAQYASCPYCASGITSTDMPAAASAGAGSFTPTEAPVSAVNYAAGQQNAAFGATIAPDVQRSNPEPFGVATTIGGDRADGDVAEPVVGWLVSISGPTRGTDYRLHAGYNNIGRESGDVRIRGDMQISRQNHAMIAYDSEENLYYFGPSAGRNIVRVNGKAVLTPVELEIYDIISVGTTKLLFVPLCSDKFTWEAQG